MKDLINSPWVISEWHKECLQDPKAFGLSYSVNRDLFLSIDKVFVKGTFGFEERIDPKDWNSFGEFQNSQAVNIPLLRRVLESKAQPTLTGYRLNPEWESDKEKKDFLKNLKSLCFYMIQCKVSKGVAPNWYGHHRVILDLYCTRIPVEMK